MSRQELADAVNVALYGPTQPRYVGGLDAKYIGKLERGVYRWPNDAYRQALRHVLGARDDAQLGLYISRAVRRDLVVREPGGPPAPGFDAIRMRVRPDDHSALPDDEGVSEWPVWFGMRLARAMSMVHSCVGVAPGTLQDMLHQEISALDAAAPDGGHPDHAVSRRQALVALATLPLTLGVAGGTGNGNAAIETFLAHCGASLTACWHLLKGSDLAVVERLLAGYLIELETVAQRPSRYQPGAAQLASQAHRISCIIALHRDQMRAREHHCHQAVRYAAIADHAGSRASALISLASTYFYQSDPTRAAGVYQQALTIEAMSPLQRSRVHAELAVVYGQLGRERETLESSELAQQLYPTLPEQDPSYLYAEFTRASLTLEHGLAYVALAQQHPGRGFARRAADIFAEIDRADRTATPDRIRFEIDNHQALTAVLLDDLDAFEGHLTRGSHGARQLGSRQREKEVHAAWRLANGVWPNERRLTNLRRELVPVTRA